MLSEYKRGFQHRLQSKCYKNIFLNLSPKKNLEVIPFILMTESIERAHNKQKKRFGIECVRCGKRISARKTNIF